MLSTWADMDGGSMYPSAKTLAEACGMHRRSILRTLDEIETAGWLEVVSQCGSAKGGIRGPTEYRVSIPADNPDDCAQQRAQSRDGLRAPARAVNAATARTSARRLRGENAPTARTGDTQSLMTPSSSSGTSRASDRVIAFIVDNRMEGKNIRDRNKYRASVEADVRSEVDLDRLDRIISMHDPDTPIEMFAGLALGEPVPYLRNYRRERNEEGAA